VALEPVRLAFIQPTPFCNINCKYCFLPDRNSPRRMSDQTLRQTFQFLFARPELVAAHLDVLWHAGEPLAVPAEFYETACQIQAELTPAGISLTNCIQTNGTLISQEWCDLIKRRKISIGVSLDGPREIHDANRVGRSGKGTFDKVIRGIRLLQANEIDFSVIGVVSEHSLDHAEEMWNFYHGLGISRIHLLMEELQGVHTLRALRKENLSRRLESFFRTLLECRQRDNPSAYIRELDAALHRIHIWPTRIREIEQRPIGIINVSWDGKVSTLSPELLAMNLPQYGEFVLAYVDKNKMEDIIEHPVLRAAFRDVMAGLKACQSSCAYFGLCGGGQPSIKLYENGSFNSTETPSCQMRIKAAINANLAFLEQEKGFSDGSGLPVTDRIEKLKLQNPGSAGTDDERPGAAPPVLPDRNQAESAHAQGR